MKRTNEYKQAISGIDAWEALWNDSVKIDADKGNIQFIVEGEVFFSVPWKRLERHYSAEWEEFDGEARYIVMDCFWKAIKKEGRE